LTKAPKSDFWLLLSTEVIVVKQFFPISSSKVLADDKEFFPVSMKKMSSKSGSGFFTL